MFYFHVRLKAVNQHALVAALFTVESPIFSAMRKPVVFYSHSCCSSKSTFVIAFVATEGLLWKMCFYVFLEASICFTGKLTLLAAEGLLFWMCFYVLLEERIFSARKLTFFATEEL